MNKCCQQNSELCGVGSYEDFKEKLSFKNLDLSYYENILGEENIFNLLVLVFDEFIVDLDALSLSNDDGDFFDYYRYNLEEYIDIVKKIDELAINVFLPLLVQKMNDYFLTCLSSKVVARNGQRSLIRKSSSKKRRQKNNNKVNLTNQKYSYTFNFDKFFDDFLLVLLNDLSSLELSLATGLNRDTHRNALLAEFFSILLANIINKAFDKIANLEKITNSQKAMFLAEMSFHFLSCQNQPSGEELVPKRFLIDLFSVKSINVKLLFSEMEDHHFNDFVSYDLLKTIAYKNTLPVVIRDFGEFSIKLGLGNLELYKFQTIMLVQGIFSFKDGAVFNFYVDKRTGEIYFFDLPLCLSQVFDDESYQKIKYFVYKVIQESLEQGEDIDLNDMNYEELDNNCIDYDLECISEGVCVDVDQVYCKSMSSVVCEEDCAVDFKKEDTSFEKDNKKGNFFTENENEILNEFSYLKSMFSGKITMLKKILNVILKIKKGHIDGLIIVKIKSGTGYEYRAKVGRYRVIYSKKDGVYEVIEVKIRDGHTYR